MTQIKKDDEKIKEEIIKNLKNIYDPEIPVNIYDLGLIYEINLETINNYKYATIQMTLTSPSCPVAESLVDQVKYITLNIPEIDEVNVNLVFNPPWDTSMMSEEAKEIMGTSGAAFW